MAASTPTKAKRPMGRPPGPKPPRQMVAAFKGSDEYVIWFRGLAGHVRKSSGWNSIPVSEVIDKALLAYAKQVGYDAPPPER